MTYDTPLRHRQALDPSGLDNIATALHALQAAAKDCADAGVSFVTDPASLLLARYLGALAIAAFPDVEELRYLCKRRLAEVDALPKLVTLLRREIDSHEAAKPFLDKADAALLSLAHQLRLSSESFNIALEPGPAYVVGEIVLQAERLSVRIAPGRPVGQQVIFRRCRSRGNRIGIRDDHGSIEEFRDIPKLAARIRRALRLAEGQNILSPSIDGKKRRASTELLLA